MSNVYRFQSKDDVYEEASRWIVAMDRELSPKEVGELHDWLTSNALHRKALYEMAEFWDKMNSLTRLSSLFPDVNRKREPRGLGVSALGVAASVLLLVCVSVVTLTYGPFGYEGSPTADAGSKSDDTLFTNVGERTVYALDDGSQLTLNTNSQVEVRFTEQHRDIFLSHGEIHVQVAKDRSRPLRVFSAGKLVEAVGTAFNIKMIDAQKLELIVTEGKVIAKRVDSDPKREISDHSPERASDRSGDTAYSEVSRGERILLSLDIPKIEAISESEMRSALSWKRGELVFRGEPLSDAIAEVSRYTNRKISISDPQLESIRIAGLFRAGDVDGLLAGLEKNFSIGHRYVDNNTIELVSLRE